jgi:flagellar biosynthesis protein FliR
MAELFSITLYNYLMIFMRIGATFMLMPGFSASYINVQMRLIIALALTFVTVPLLSPILPPEPKEFSILLQYILNEISVGIFLGIVMQILFFALNLAGSIASQAIGFSNAQVFDPTFQTQTMLIETFLSIIAITLIFITNLHHLMINAIIESYFLPDKTPASYRYENKDGLKFFVLAFNNFNLDGGFNANYLNNYYRQSGLINAITWLSGKKLPVTVTKNPNLYVLASKDEQGNCSIAFANVSIDDVYDEFIYLDGNYALAESIGFDGEFLGDKIKVNRIEPYGFVAFKLEKSL